MRTKSGDDAWFSSLASVVLRDHENKPLLFQGTLMQITQQVRNRESMRENLQKMQNENIALEGTVRLARNAAQALFTANPQINFLALENGEHISCNQAALEFYGYETEQELIDMLNLVFSGNGGDGKEFGTFFQNSARVSRTELFAQALEKGNCEFTAQIPDKPNLVGHMKCIDYAGQRAVITYFSEISENESQLEHVLEELPYACLIYDADMRILNCNTKVLKLLGTSSKEEPQRRHTEFYPEFQPNGLSSYALRDEHKSHAVEGNVYPLQWNFQREGGELVPCEITIVRVGEEDNYRLISFIRDLSELYDEKEKAREAQNYTNLMLDATPLICTVWNEEQTLLDCNMEVVRLLEINSKQQLIDDFYALSPPFQPDGASSRESSSALLRTAFEMGYAHSPWEFTTSKGESIITETSFVRVPFGSDYRVLAFSQDVREIRAVQQEITNHNFLLQTVNDITRAVLSAQPDEIDDVIPRQLEQLSKAAGAGKCYIWENFTDDEGKVYGKRIYSWPSSTLGARAASRTLSYSDAPFLREKLFAGENVSSTLQNLDDASAALYKSSNPKTMLVIPLFLNDGLWGVIGFEGHRSDELFSQATAEILKSCGNLLVSAIVRNRTNMNLITTSNELSLHSSLLRAVNEVATTLISEQVGDITPLVQSALQTLGQSVRADRVAIWQNFENENGVLCARRLPSWVRGQSFSEANGEEIIDIPSYLPEWQGEKSERKPINLPLKMMNANWRKIATQQNMQSFLLLSIDIAGEFWGFIGYSYTHFDARMLSPAAIGILQSGGALIASAITRSETSRQLREASELALASVQAKNEFLAHMSHEIKTPLNAIIGMTTLAQNSEDIAHIRECLDVVSASSEHLVQIITDILDVSNTSSGRILVEEYEFDFAHMLGEVYEEVEELLEAKNQQLTLGFAHPFERLVRSDARRISQVISHLLKNAVKFSGEGKTIALSISEEALTPDTSMLSITVQDQGIGIDSENILRLFDAFEQNDGSLTRAYGGTGLGLTICRNIVAGLGGTIRVESTPSEGSTFYVNFPVKWGLPANSTKGERAHGLALSSLAAAAETQVMPQNWGDKTVLLVEDVEINRFIIMELLAATGINIECAENGEEALAMFTAAPTHFDIILMDMQMPVMDGVSATRAIRASGKENAKNVPIYAMTAHSFLEDIERCIEAGMNGHIAKPVDFALLIKTMGEALAE